MKESTKTDSEQNPWETSLVSSSSRQQVLREYELWESTMKIVTMPGSSCVFKNVFCGQILQRRCITFTRRCHAKAKDLFKDAGTLRNVRLTRKVTPIFVEAQKHYDKRALEDQHGIHTYENILTSANDLASNILEILNCNKLLLEKERISFLCPNNVSHVVAQWATWICGGIAVPLCTSHPPAELKYFIEDSQSSLILYTEEFEEHMKPLLKGLTIPSLMLKKRDYVVERPQSNVTVTKSNAVQFNRKNTQIKNFLRDNIFKNREALIIYTSGTTGKPKGVVHTYGSLDMHIKGMISTWKWTDADVILHVLPLHHVHGLVNALMTPLYVGATCRMMPNFDAEKVWKELTNTATSKHPQPVTIFMAVPTIYAKLIQYYEAGDARHPVDLSKDFIKAVCSERIRLMVSGSAPLTNPIMSRWEQITGHRLLERYGMTETGMVLTNSIDGPKVAGCVGNPFPEVEVCISKPNIYEEKGYDVICKGHSRRTVVNKGMENEQGELLVKGPNVFQSYWNRPEETEKAFTADGWFKTGDTAAYQDGVYKILGRTSVDIIKSGGYKISALEIEHHLLEHPDIIDVAVVGLPDVTWGQLVAAVVVTVEGKSLSLQDIKKFCEDKIAVYKIPTMLKVIEAMPRNAMGKVNKKELVHQVFPQKFQRII